MTDPRLGIVIPTLNEARHLPRLLDDLAHLDTAHRVVVVDGGSRDGTRTVARGRGARVVEAPRGRSSQLRAGARTLRSPWLLFLHADVRVPPPARRLLDRWLEADGHGDDAAFFRFRLAGDRWLWRLIEAGQRIRERVTGLAYGDQGLLVRRRVFQSVGGFPDLPIMEDVEIVRRLRRRGPVRRLPAAVVSSPRRYEREGPLRAVLRNGLLVCLHLAGVAPGTLARWYRSPPPDDSRPPTEPAAASHETDGGSQAPSLAAGRRVLLVFAKAPVPGRVKTRLARTLGDERAAELYRRIGRGVVDRVRDGPWRTVVVHAPPDAAPAVRRWLGDDVELRPQASGDLGERMASAFGWAFDEAGARRVCIVGTDAPAVDRSGVEAAFTALDDADVVIGPATDGGYYLLALDRPREWLFRNVPWSTDRVLSRTLRAASEHGLHCRLLDEAVDLDTADDLDRLDLGGVSAGLRSKDVGDEPGP